MAEGEARFLRRIALEAELAAESGADLTEAAERLPAVPDAPVVDVAAGGVRVARHIIIQSVRRRSRPERAGRIELLHGVSQNADAFHVRPMVVVGVGFDTGPRSPPGRPAFVVAAPQRQRSASSETPHLIFRLGADIVEKSAAGIVAAREHEVLPDEQPQFVAQIVEDILLVLSAAPDADHVHIRRFRAFEKVTVALRCLPVFERVTRDPVRAFREKHAAVHTKCKPQCGIAGFGIDTLFIDKLNFPQPDPLFDFPPLHLKRNLM